MFFYLSLFLLFIGLYKLAELRESKWLLSFSIIVPSLFEGLRDDVVGQDMLGYGSQWFDYMDETDSVFTILELAQTPEYAYHLLIYICKFLSSDIHLFMTACALIKMTIVTSFVWKMRERLSSVLFLFSYYCFFYVTFFSMMRQGIAVAICIYSLVYFVNKNIWKFLLTVVIAYFFHNSAILMLLLIPIYYMKDLKWKYSIIFGSIIFIYISIEALFELVLMTPLFKSEMADLYIDSGVPSAKTNILISLVFCGYAVYQHFWGEEEHPDSVYLLLITSAMTLLFLLLSSYIEVAFRMSYYVFIVSLLITTSLIYESVRLRYPIILCFVFLFLLHFYISCQHGLSGALEYTSQILGIEVIG